MHRREFIRGVTAAGTTGAGLANAAQSVTYKVKGFTCVTCAVGLEVMLRRRKGVIRADASYAEHKVSIGFDKNVTSEKELKAFIVECGFLFDSEPLIEKV